MTFHSILNFRPGKEMNEAPPYFIDLNLDQIVGAITAGKDEYNLKPFFYSPLGTWEEVEYRHAVMRDVDDDIIFDGVTRFATKMRTARDSIEFVGKLYYKYQKDAWLLEAIDVYCQATRGLLSDLEKGHPASSGFVGLIEYLSDYTGSESFRQLTEEIARIKARLSSIRYKMVVGNGVITVSDYSSEADYSTAIQADFDKFKQGAASDHQFKFLNSAQMNHIEAGVLNCVARLFPDAFASLEAFALTHSDALDATVRRFDREVQFYVAYLEYIRRLQGAGLRFSYPRVSRESKDIRTSESFDLALANSLVGKNVPVVTNDFFMRGKDRIIVVSGPNQGGKTTFARMFGQLHHLASIGCSVPGVESRLFLFDHIFAHFERAEDIHNLRGKLHDDLFRLRNTLSQASSNSIIIMNEVFSSTSLKDAVFLSTNIMAKIIKLDAICVCVTFIDELTTLSHTTVSMASNVRPGNVAERTYKIIRRPSDGLAYAISIAEKYQLTYTQLREQLKA